jgi:NADPH2:quinone reductase
MGTWRQYSIANKNAVIPFPDGTDAEKVCATFVNPITVLCIAHYAKNKGHKAIIHGAAASALGKMLVKHAKQIGLPLINLVRRDEQVTMLKDIGAEIVINTSDADWQDQLKEHVKTHEATGYFDPIGGDFTGQVLDCLAPDSTAYVYGGLSGKPVTYSPLGLIFGQKTISYLWIGPWMKSLTEEERGGVVGTIIQDLCTGGEIFGSAIAKRFPLSKFADAIKSASDNASDGKTIFTPQEE